MINLHGGDTLYVNDFVIPHRCSEPMRFINYFMHRINFKENLAVKNILKRNSFLLQALLPGRKFISLNVFFNGLITQIDHKTINGCFLFLLQSFIFQAALLVFPSWYDGQTTIRRVLLLQVLFLF